MLLFMIFFQDRQTSADKQKQASFFVHIVIDDNLEKKTETLN